ncbi:putative quinol monooxygenase [Mycoplasma zalophidermidis]|uniref:Antibiotic biosynthesis monooxygenase n=1 Tax=Mycoplasma zalophidermidis TaxID=398174 RepID=A0ABS6DSK7_9MOLU|nr:antibiotic biosynthesis monooxygenase [Mycoplasma zalophidermidis]MBU4689675.1 antibiotic biosynthesis monooxygenase [Mycoplasma zalophidermidis]MBU4693575.1 antibiotic biosynthesis monooxygenase [Mycoplasma zalophidermidis]MCR8966466.1 antibiotic biosynthesis monooxygenase [Mycoplasma zalophidermidis]
MIYIVSKEIKIKKESKDEFNKFIKEWIYKSKQQELNLSIDGFWVADKFLIFERWSSEESFLKFTKLPEYKEFLTTIESFGTEPLKVKKFKTII